MQKLFDSNDALKILIWAPKCDKQTNETALWARELTVQSGAQCERLIGRLEQSSILRSLGEAGGMNSTASFLGHGLEDALIGHPYRSEESLPLATKIYTSQMIADGPRSLFAFCCDAGSDLGPLFGQSRDQTFLGFSGTIWIYVKNDFCRLVWRDLIQRLLDKVVEDQALSMTHFVLYSQWLDQAFEYYANGEGRSREESLSMRICLQRQQNVLVFHGRQN